MTSISYHDTVKFLQGRIDKVSSPFARIEWLELLEKSQEAPLFVCADTKRCRFVLPLTERNDRLESLINWYNFTWEPITNGAFPTSTIGAGKPLPLGIVSPATAERQEMFRAIAWGLKSKTHRVTLWPLPDEAQLATDLEEGFRRAGWNVLREQCDYNHILQVKGRSFAEYWAGRPGKMRTTLQRKSKKVAVEIHQVFDAEAWADYERIYQNSWKPEEGDPALLRQFAQQEGAAGRIRLAIARHEGVAVAAQFWTVEGGGAYIHKLAHLEEMKNLSAGTTLTAALFEQVIEKDQVEIVDFGTGNDPYKADWMEEVRPRFRLDCLNLDKLKTWPIVVKRTIRRLAQVPQQS